MLFPLKAETGGQVDGIFVLQQPGFLPEGVTRKLVGFEMVDRGIPRHGYELVNDEGEKVGVVTSGTMSPTRKIGIGMGYVKPEYSKVGTEICIDMRGRKLKAVVVKPPFRK